MICKCIKDYVNAVLTKFIQRMSHGPVLHTKWVSQSMVHMTDSAVKAIIVGRFIVSGEYWLAF